MTHRVYNMEFQTHHNGGRPFTVKVNDGAVDIFHNNSLRQRAETPFYTINYKSLLIGDDACACLVVGRDDRAYYICDEVYAFSMPIEPSVLTARIGNSDVVYAYTVAGGDIYMLSEHVIFNTDQMVDSASDVYDFYYRNCATIGARPMDIDIIVTRYALSNQCR